METIPPEHCPKDVAISKDLRSSFKKGTHTTSHCHHYRIGVLPSYISAHSLASHLIGVLPPVLQQSPHTRPPCAAADIVTYPLSDLDVGGK